MADTASVGQSLQSAAPAKRWDRQLILAMLLGACIVLPRSWDMSRKLSQYMDDEWHLVRGLRFMEHRVGDTVLNDPPLGPAIGALPLLIEGTRERKGTETPLYGHPVERAMMRLVIIRMWKSLLFIPLLGVIFAWMRDLYGRAAAWLAVGIFCLEPNIAAHIPTPALDLIGAAGILISVYTLWRFYQRPTIKRLLVASIMMAVAMLLKNTAFILPGIAILFAGLWWIVRPVLLRKGEPSTIEPSSQPPVHLVSPIAAVSLGAGVVFVCLWVLCLFDISRPTMPTLWLTERPGLVKMLNWPMPMGIYVSSICQALDHGQRGHSAYLFGQISPHGWWYYFPVVCWYKVPIGIGALLLLGVISLWRTRPRWDEWALFLPMIAWSIWLMSSGINIGIRHFLPAYMFMLLLSCRWMRGAGAIGQVVAWLCVGAAGISGLTYHPDYIAYFNWPRYKPYLAINDSNVDWAQSLIEARQWVNENPPGDRPVSVVVVLGMSGPRRQLYLGDGIQVVSGNSVPPRAGLLILSPIREVGDYDKADRYAPLRSERPIAIIGHNLLVYDLDRVPGWAQYVDRLSVESVAERPQTQPSTEPATTMPAKKHKQTVKTKAVTNRKAR